MNHVRAEPPYGLYREECLYGGMCLTANLFAATFFAKVFVDAASAFVSTLCESFIHNCVSTIFIPVSIDLCPAVSTKKQSAQQRMADIQMSGPKNVAPMARLRDTEGAHVYCNL